MDRKSRLLLTFFLLVVGTVVYFGYQKFFVELNFVLESTIECDPRFESCFVWCEDECEENYYKKIAKKAYNVPACSNIFECEPPICELGEEECEITTCSEETVEVGEICTNPIDFQMEDVPTATSTESVP